MANETEEIKLVDKEVVEGYLNDEKVSKNLLMWAKHFEEKFRNNSFTAQQLLKKTIIKTVPEIEGVLSMLVLKKFAMRIGNDKYKITLSKGAQAEIVRERLEETDRQIIQLTKDKVKLEEELRELSAE